MFRSFASNSLRSTVFQRSALSTLVASSTSLPSASIAMKSRLLKSLQIGTLLLMALQPSPSFCVEARGGDNNGKGKDVPFSEWLRNIKETDGINFDNVNDIIAKSFKPGGPMVPVKEFFESGIPGNFGYGFMMGFSSGYCIRKVSKLVAFVVGAGFIMIQTLQYNGLIDVKYDKVEHEVTKALDLNKDGKLDEKDLQVAHDKIQEVLGSQMPAGGGFATGLFMGLRG